MAEGGYDPNETGGHGNDGYHDDDDDENTGLLDRERQEEERRRWQESHSPRRTGHGVGGVEVAMKHRTYPPIKPYEPSTKTSTSKSGEQETSFMGGRDILETRQEAHDELDKDIREVFPNIKKKLIPLIRRDEYNQLVLNLGKTNSKDWIIAFEGEPSHVIDKSKFPKGVREDLGKTNIQINQESQEAYEKQQEEQAKRERVQQEAREREEASKQKLYDANDRLINLRNSLAEQERARNSVETPEEAESKTESINVIKRSIRSVEGEVRDYTREEKEARNAVENADVQVEEGERQVETARERVNERLLSLRDRIKAIFRKYGFTAFAVATAIGTVIGVIVSNLKAGLTKVAKGVGNGLKELGKKLGEILPGMIGAIASFLFRTAGEVIGFLAKNAWLLIVGLVVLAVEQFKKKSG